MKKNDVKIEIITPKISKKKEDAFWYYDKQIAEVTFNGRRLSVEATGEIELRFKENGKLFYGKDAVKEAKRLKLNDNGLAKLDAFDGFRLNNWFAIREIEEDNSSHDDVDIQHDYDSAMASAVDYIQGEGGYLKVYQK